MLHDTLVMQSAKPRIQKTLRTNTVFFTNKLQGKKETKGISKVLIKETYRQDLPCGVCLDPDANQPTFKKYNRET